MLIHKFKTKKAALAAISKIDAKRGKTEKLRLPDGSIAEVPATPWAAPIAMKDGSYAVTWKDSLEKIYGISKKEIGGKELQIEKKDYASVFGDKVSLWLTLWTWILALIQGAISKIKKIFEYQLSVELNLEEENSNSKEETEYLKADIRKNRRQ